MQQQTIQNHLLSAVTKHAVHYSTFVHLNECDSDSFYGTDFHDDFPDSPLLNPLQHMDIKWQTPVLTGETGCGKSYTINSFVNRSVENNVKVLVAAPTGFLASVFRATLPEDVCCETVHAAFHFPVPQSTGNYYSMILSSSTSFQ